MPLQKLDVASEWKPLRELGKAERIERPDLDKRLPKQVERKTEASNFN
jgi:hypothetical protein